MDSRSENQPRPARTVQYGWGTLEWRLDDTLVPGAGMSVAVVTLRSGQTSPLHRHPNCGEFLTVARGRVEITIDGKKSALEEGDSAWAPAGTVHGFRNPGEGDARLVLSFSSGKRIYEEV